MSLNFDTARDEMATLVKTAWDAATTSKPLLYDDVNAEPPQTGAWGRLTIQHGPGTQESLADANGKKLWNRTGLLTIQIFSESGFGLSTHDSLSTLMVNALQGKTTPGGVWFRNVRMNEIGPDGKWYNVNVVAEFTYDQLA